MGLEEDKTSTTKHLYNMVQRDKDTQKERLANDRGRETIDYMDNCKSSFTSSAFWTRG
jgi:hypothetical protein